MQAVVSLCEKVIVLHHGEKIAEGTPEEVILNPSEERTKDFLSKVL